MSTLYKLRRVVAVVGLILLVTTNGFCWGQEGHRIISIIAEKHLTPEVRQRIQPILGPNLKLADVSTWADEIRPSRPETAPWHYIDMPLDASAIDPARDCPNESCVSAAINRSIAVLQDKNSPAETKNEALKFVIHFVADLHQPLHCADNHDRGGNDVHVTFFGKGANLHSAWDTLLIERIDPDPEHYASRLDADLTDSEIGAFDQGTVEDWALESHAVAQKVAYGALPRQDTPDLGTDYFKAAERAADLQLEKAGIRLAFILNEALQ